MEREMDEITLIKVKTIVIGTIQGKIYNINKEIDRYKGMTMTKKICEVEKLKLDNLKTEICLSLDNEFKNNN